MPGVTQLVESTDDPAAAEDRISAWAALLRVHAALVPALERELAAAHRLPLSWYDVLLELNSAPQRRLRMSELGSRVVLSRERVSRVVDELARAGLVVRERNPDDKRSVFAVLSPAGRDRLRAAAPTYLAGIERHFTSHLFCETRGHSSPGSYSPVNSRSAGCIPMAQPEPARGALRPAC